MIFDLYDSKGDRITYTQMPGDFNKGDSFRIGGCLFEFDKENNRYVTLNNPILMIEGYKIK